MKNRNSKKLRLFVRAAVLMCALFVVFTGCPQQLDPPAPRETVYTVEHRQQNADNDEYTLAERETVYAKEGETTRAQSKNYPGFTAQSFSQMPVKADGSTVVRINYHRNIISLKLNGLPDGSASAQLVDGSTLQGRFGVKVTLTLPEKSGFVPLWKPPLPVSFPAAPEQDYTFSWVDGYEITIKGDERTQIHENTVYKVSNTGKTLKDIKAQLQAQVQFASEWRGGDYEVYEWRLGGESGEKLTDDYPINNHISVYAVTNYAKFNITDNKITLTVAGNGYTGNHPRGKIILPENITEIEGTSYKGAFWRCTGLTSVSFPASLTSIGVAAFADCTGLMSVSLPLSLTSIGERAFADCTGLTSISLPASLTSIGTAAFAECTDLTSISFPARLTSIGAKAFWKCTGLTSVSLPVSLTSIGEHAFADCGLTSVSLPLSLTSIGEGAFVDCTGLTSADFADKNGWAVYEDKDCTQKSEDITPDDLNDGSKAVRYLCKYQSDGGYADTYWKKN